METIRYEGKPPECEDYLVLPAEFVPTYRNLGYSVRELVLRSDAEQVIASQRRQIDRLLSELAGRAVAGAAVEGLTRHWLYSEDEGKSDTYVKLADVQALVTAKATGRDLYLARHEEGGAKWESNDHQESWNDWAERLNARLAARAKVQS
jgi:hypothetical protein